MILSVEASELAEWFLRYENASSACVQADEEPDAEARAKLADVSLCALSIAH